MEIGALPDVPEKNVRLSKGKPSKKGPYLLGHPIVFIVSFAWLNKLNILQTFKFELQTMFM